MIIATFVLSVLGGTFDWFILNDEVRNVSNYADELGQVRSAIGTRVLFVVALVATVAMLVAYVGLFFFWNAARYIYLLLFAGMVVVVPFLGTYVSSGEQKLIVDLSNVFSGFLLAAIFISPIKSHFDKRASVAV